jgi:hypothetical protein
LIVKAVAAAKVDCAPIAKAIFGPETFSARLALNTGRPKDTTLAKAIAEGAKVGISKRHIQRARAKLGLITPTAKRAGKPQSPWKADIRQVITKARRTASADTIRHFILALLKG